MTKTEFIKLLENKGISSDKEKTKNAADRIIESNMDAFRELAK